MKTYFAILLMSGFVSWILTPLARRVAIAVGAVDHPETRKIHSKPMPRLGGLAVFAGFCSPFPLLYLIQNRVSMTFQDHERMILAMLVAALLMLGLGIYDDMKGASAWKKFSIQISAALVLFFGGFQIAELSNPFGPPWKLGWLSAPITVLWIVAITNAMNLLDGIDGLATGVTFCIALALAFINILHGQVMVALLTLCLAGACLGFLPHNFSPATIFLGDTGSLFLGLALACISILSLFKAATATLIAVPILLFGLPLFDTVSVVIGRLWRRAPIFSADKTHVHHRLLRMGWNQREAAFLLYGVTLVMGTIAIDLSLRHSMATIAFGAVLLAALIAAIVIRARRPPPGNPLY